MRKNWLLLLLMAIVTTVHAGEYELRKFNEALLTAFPASQGIPHSIEVGDLNGDGLADFAVIFYPNAEPSTLAVFLKKKNSGYHLLSASKEITNNPLGSTEVQIKKGHLYLLRSGSMGCCEGFEERFQFGMRKGNLVLLGEESKEFSKTAEDASAQGQSINYSTGTAKFWKVVGNKKKEVQKAFAMPHSIALGSFSAGNGEWYFSRSLCTAARKELEK